MPRPKVSDADFIDFLIATPRRATATEAVRTQPPAGDPGVAAAAHDAYTRLLHRLEPDAQALWEEVRPDVRLTSGMLVLDDSVLDKPYARKMDLVHHQWSRQAPRRRQGDRAAHAALDRRGQAPAVRLPAVRQGRGRQDEERPPRAESKGRELLDVAKGRGFSPECVLFDGWYGGLENLKHLRSPGWHWMTRLKTNRRVNPDRTGLRAVSDCEIAGAGTVVHLEGYGLVKVFRIGAEDGTADHWATDDLTMDDLNRLRLADASRRIEEYHRGIKQTTNVERCQCRVGRARRGHIGLALRAFVILERYCFRTGANRLTAKREIPHEAIRICRTNPYHRRLETA
jgi:hypothetical protein